MSLQRIKPTENKFEKTVKTFNEMKTRAQNIIANIQQEQNKNSEYYNLLITRLNSLQNAIIGMEEEFNKIQNVIRQFDNKVKNKRLTQTNTKQANINITLKNKIKPTLIPVSKINEITGLEEFVTNKDGRRIIQSNIRTKSRNNEKSNNMLLSSDLLREFLTSYLLNLQESIDKNKTIPEQNYELINKVYNYLDFINKIFLNKKTEDFRDLFIHLIKLYESHKNNLNKYKKPQDFYFIHAHGNFLPSLNIHKVPENTVLIFLTPINRLGVMICPNTYINNIINAFSNPENRQYYQSNIFCINKTDGNSFNNNNRRFKETAFFKSSLVLYSGQYYYDLELTFNSEEFNRGFGIHYFGDKKSYMKLDVPNNKFNMMLSNLLNSGLDN
jgi:hypothetical protein